MSKENSYLYKFGEFCLDARAKILFRENVAVPLKPKAIEILIALVEDAGNVVEKKDLMNRVWQDVFVEENNLSVNIYELRRAFVGFGEAGKFIETVPRRGFRFSQPVEKICAAEKSLVRDETDEKTVAANDGKIDDGNFTVEIAQTSEANFNQTSPAFEKRNSFGGAPPMRYGRSNFAVAFMVLVLVIGGSSFYAWRAGAVERIETQTNDAANARRTKEERGTNSIEAYQFYLRGRELWKTRDNLKMEKGIEFFRRAIEFDPNFAAPYEGIADSLSMMRNDAEDWRQAEEYARKAIALAPASADARASLAFILAMDKWQWREAEAEFQAALALDENSGKTHQWYATLLEIERRYDEAETHLKRAIEIDPLSGNYNADLCELYSFADRYDDAFAQCRKMQQISPDAGHNPALMNIYIAQKRYDEAAQEFIENDRRRGASEAETKNVAWYRAYKKDGFRGWVLSDINAVEHRSDVQLHTYNLSLNYARLGEREKTLELLEKCADGHNFMLPFANARPEFDFLREDARFRALMRRIGLNQN